ncbi:Queuine tRNA-ribosyltransferase subunit qtrtd1 [Actinomortierella ambigua]|uniref:Queuine tRNA-ribosyltransferase accessory subunit 2 n=1 Tax=Actinomortierella ambigua TaxID=1343610 RepID=A0A9P6TZP7_9FUNG|nr:Queuine tRNA-ribosyltransferase subunit qtrtd1 [Actinomortierella ambigua]
MPPLNFSIIRQSTQLSSARRGTLAITHAVSETAVVANTQTKSGFESTVRESKKRVIETPGCLMYTAKGSVPHLTPDTMRLQSFGGASVSIEHVLQDYQPAGFEKFPFNLATYLNLQDFILLCDIRDTSKFVKVPFNSDRYVSMVTHQGVRQLTLEDYLKCVRTYEPDVLASFSDFVSDLEPGQKRVRKSVDRSLKWLDQLLMERQGLDGLAQDREADMKKKENQKKNSGEASSAKEPKETTPAPAAVTPKPWKDVGVFAHVLGSHIEDERIRSATETAKRDVEGFIIDATSLAGSKDDVQKLIKTSLDNLPSNKPKVVYGMQAPEDVLKSIALGVDLFDTSYPFVLTEDGKASLFSFGPEDSADAKDERIVEPRWINLWDEEHADKFVPLMTGCECYSCKGGKHTRAYINHLLKTHEMLATVLLMSHNMYQYSRFFENVRKSIEQDTFDQYSQDFMARWGTEPERTGEIHPVAAMVEASLHKRNRLDDDASSIASGQQAPKGKGEKKERVFVNKKEKRLKKQQEKLEKQPSQ